MPKKTCRRVTIRLYNPEIIRMIESVPRGLRSTVIQSALVAYLESGRHCTLLKNFDSAGGLVGEELTLNQDKRDVFARLVGDF